MLVPAVELRVLILRHGMYLTKGGAMTRPSTTKSPCGSVRPLQFLPACHFLYARRLPLTTVAARATLCLKATVFCLAVAFFLGAATSLGGIFANFPAPALARAYALEPGETQTSTDPDGNGLNVSKYVEANDDGTFTITLEQWLDGVESKVPLDFVMVLDVSGSMDDEFVDNVYAADIRTDKIYYLLLTDGSYAPVSYCTYCEAWYRYDYSYFSSATNEHRYWAGRWGSYGYAYYNYHENYTQYPPKSSASSSGYYFYDYQPGKLSNLKAAANEFVDIVADAARENGVEHHIELIKFADTLSYDVGDDDCTFSYRKGDGSVGTTTGNCTQIVVPFADAATQSDELQDAINGLHAMGSTRTDYALQLAKYSIDNSTDEHHKVVVLFTDGEPQDEMGDITASWSSDDVAVANRAIESAHALKANGVEVFTVGLLEDLNDSVPASTATPTSVSQKNTRFLHALSSNYAAAEDMDTLGAYCGNAYDERYFYGTSESTELEGIFSAIATRAVQEATLQLPATAVMHDAVTPYFDLVEGSVSCRTQAYDGSAFTGEEVPVTLDTSVSQRNDGTTVLEVSGFSFEDEYVMPTVKESGDFGKKLLVSFNISPKDDFIGGNAVPTNVADSGIYDAQGALVDEYPQPLANVPLAALNVTAADKHVYALDDLSAAELLSGVQASYTGRWSGTAYPLTFDGQGQSTLDWQDDYASVVFSSADASGQPVGNAGFAQLSEDSSFTVRLDAQPRLNAAQASSGVLAAPNRNPGVACTNAQTSDEGNIYVYKPILTFKDAIVQYAQDAPDEAFYLTRDYEQAKTVWAHVEYGSAANNPMVHDEPALALSFQANAAAFNQSRVATLDDIPVYVTVTRDGVDMDPYVRAYLHHDCNTADACVWEDCSWPEAYLSDTPPFFLLHVQADYVLPRAGGPGALPWALGGALLAAAGLVAGLVAGRRIQHIRQI